MMNCIDLLRRRLAAGTARTLLLAGLCLAGPASQAASLLVDDGVVVKFGARAGMVVRSELSTGDQVVFTSLKDDSVAGSSDAAAASPSRGDWRGVQVSPAVVPERLGIDGLDLRYAGAAENAALDISGNYLLRGLRVRDSVRGIRVGAGTPQISDSLLLDNGSALESTGATPSIAASELVGNTFGVLNQTPASVVLARGNWWGHASGPTDAQNNPGGSGDAVSAGVDYAAFLGGAPLRDCAVAVAHGNTVRVEPTVPLTLSCRNAVEYRLAESTDFSGVDFAPMVATVEFLLSPAAGTKQIHAEFRSAAGISRVVSLAQALLYSPGLPVVEILAPAANATLGADAEFSVSASDASGIVAVELHVGDRLLASDSQPPYAANIVVAEFASGDYVLKAVARSQRGQVSEATRSIRIQNGTPDSEPPLIGDARFGADSLAISGTTALSAPGQLRFAVSDASGVSSARATLDGVPLAGASFDGEHYTAFVAFDGVANGAHTFVLEATDASGNRATQAHAVTLAMPAPLPPQILAPLDGTVGQALVAVSGSAQPGSKVQMYLNGSAAGPLLPVGANGLFGASVSLPGEGGHQIHATAANDRGTSAASTLVLINYAVPAPTVLITAPSEAARLSDDVDIVAAAIDPVGLASVAFTVDGALRHTATQPPYSWRWPLAGVADGEHRIEVAATSTVGKTTTASRRVTVARAAEPPAPPQTAYTGVVLDALPAASYGEQDIVISGRSVARSDSAALPNSLLRLVLSVGGFQRKINVVTDAQGDFRFVFKPQPSDAGVFGVSANHPDEAVKPAQKNYTISRVRLSPGDYNLHAARTVSTPVRLQASTGAGEGIRGFRLAIEAAEQPGGALPPGLSVTLPPAQDIASNGSVDLDVRVLAALQSGDTGVIVLSAYAADSGNAKRGKVNINYRLSDPQPSLWPSPAALSSGVKRGQQVTETVTLKNRGALTAQAVTAQLVEASPGAGVPGWISLSSGGQLGDIDIGASAPIQIVATPGSGVTDGVYRVNIAVGSANAQNGAIPLSIAVTDANVGSVTFKVEDIYTDPTGKYGPPVLGLEGASVRVQNEAVLSEVSSGRTGPGGLLRLDNLPLGNYVYRVSAPNRADASGRILVKPVGQNGTSPILEEVFLDYELVSFEWSVTETTIQDRYDVRLEATYRTNVPAPVVLIEPSAINIPDLQAGEEFSGELTITNYGLVRADNVRFVAPQSSPKLAFEFSGEVPTSLDANKRVRLAYKVTALQTFPGDSVQLGSNQSPFAAKTLIGQPKLEICNPFNAIMAVYFNYECTNGTNRDGNSRASFNKLWGQCWGESDPTGGGGPGPAGGPWGHAGYPPGTSINPPDLVCAVICTVFCCNPEGAQSGGGPGVKGGGGVVGGGALPPGLPTPGS